MGLSLVSSATVVRVIHGLSRWCELNRVTINVKKTKLMLFGTNNMLKKAMLTNYLGVKLDCKLNFEHHAQECMRLVSHKLYMLSKIRNYITIHQALTIYKSKILPYFDYGDIFYINTFVRRFHKLQRLQNRGLKLCLGYHARYDTELLHHEAKVAKLEPRRTCHLLNFVFHRVHNPKYTKVVNRQLRRFEAPILTETVPNNSSFSRSVLYQGAMNWNLLPVNERNILDYENFKQVQKKKLLN